MLLYIWLIFSFALSGAYLTISVGILSSPTALLLPALCAVFSTSYFLIGILRDLGFPIEDDISWFSLQIWFLRAFFFHFTVLIFFADCSLAHLLVCNCIVLFQWHLQVLYSFENGWRMVFVLYHVCSPISF